MKPLSIIQFVMTWLCICPMSSETSRFKRTIRFLFPVLTFLLVAIFVIFSVEYILVNIKTDLDGTLFALLQIVAFSGMLYTLCIGLILRKKVNAILVALDTFYQKNEKEDFFKYLMQTNKTCEFFSRIYFTCMPIVNFLSVTVKSLISVVMCWMHSNFTDLLHPYQVVLPWDISTASGYILENIYCVVVGKCYFSVNGAFLLLFISLCLHHRAFYEMFAHSLNKLDHLNGHQAQTKLLRDSIRFHNASKRLFIDSARIYEPFTLIVLIGSMIYLACDLFLVDRQFNEPNSGSLLLVIIFGIGLSNLFVYCYFGKLASESYTKMGECLYSSSWNRLPVHLQQYIPFMIQNMQRPLEYSGFDIATLNLETFTKLMKNLFSCYMMFKKFSA